MSAVESAPSRAARARERARERARARRLRHGRPPEEPEGERRWPYWLALAGILAVALALRLWGVAQGLPYAYNADENAHFVPGAIGLFGHGLNPHYFVNPPAYTYLLHVVFGAWFGGRAGVSNTFAAPSDRGVRRRAVTAAVVGTLAVWLLYLAGGRFCDRRVGLLAAALLAVALLRSSTRTSRSTMSRRSRRSRCRCGAPPASFAAGACSTTRSPESASAWPARRSTPGASCSCRCSRRAACNSSPPRGRGATSGGHARATAFGGLLPRGAARARARSSSRTRSRSSTSRVSRRPEPPGLRPPRTTLGKLGLTQSSGQLTTCGRSRGVSAGFRSSPASSAGSACSCGTAAWRSSSCRRRSSTSSSSTRSGSSVAGLLSFGLTIWSFAAINAFAGAPDGLSIGRGWGIWLSLIGSIVLVVTAFLAALVREPDAAAEIPPETTTT